MRLCQELRKGGIRIRCVRRRRDEVGSIGGNNGNSVNATGGDTDPGGDDIGKVSEFNQFGMQTGKGTRTKQKEQDGTGKKKDISNTKKAADSTAVGNNNARLANGELRLLQLH